MTTLPGISYAFGAVLCAASLFFSGTAWADEDTTQRTRDGWERVETIHPAFAPEGTLSVQNTNGAIVVLPSKDGALTVTIHKVVRPRESLWRASRNAAATEARAMDALDDLSVEVTGSPSDLTMKSGKLPEQGRFHGAIHYTIELPVAAMAELRTENGSVRAEGAGRQITAVTTNGKITLEGVAGAVTARSTNGAICLVNVAGPVAAETVNGSIDARGLRETLEATSVNGGITCLYDGALPLDGAIVCRTNNGGISLTAAPESTFALHASTDNGSVHTEFPLSVTGRLHPRAVDALVGAGGAAITLRTTNGSIAVNHG